MTGADLQTWLNAHGAHLLVDGKPGALTCAAIPAVFSNPSATSVTDSEIAAIALRLGCMAKQLRAVAKVESGGSAFDTHGRPKILFERHLFSRLTNRVHDVCAFSNPDGGGYGEDSWDKLGQAACVDADAAFAAASWGKFQILGMHWKALGYPSALEMAYSTVGSEAAHYEMLARFVEANHLQAKLKALSASTATNKPFADAYNGPQSDKFNYSAKLAAAMA